MKQQTLTEFEKYGKTTCRRPKTLKDVGIKIMVVISLSQTSSKRRMHNLPISIRFEARAYPPEALIQTAIVHSTTVQSFVTSFDRRIDFTTLQGCRIALSTQFRYTRFDLVPSEGF